MDKSSKKLLFGAALGTIILTVLLYAQFPASFLITFNSWKLQDGLAGESLKLLLNRLLTEEEGVLLNMTGFSCHYDLHSELCLTNDPVYLEDEELTVYSPYDQKTNITNYIIQPYPRREDPNCMKDVSPVHINRVNNTKPPACRYAHNVPALIFSSGGFSGNTFHEFNELIIPLYLTSYHFQSRVQFVITDFNYTWVSKYRTILTHLSRYSLINPAKDVAAHCFPGAVIGLKYHDNLSINSTLLPQGYSIFNFKQFLRQLYKLKFQDVRDIENPTVLFLSRSGSRRFLNEHELVKMMEEEMGFRVVITRSENMSTLEEFSELVNSCNVMIGAHGAGLTNAMFLPDGAVVVQVVPLQLDWPSNAYFGEPSMKMGLKYIEYKIEVEESSLYYKYGRDHPVISDPESITVKGYQATRAVYIEGQDMKINLQRFRDTLERVVKLLRP